MKWLLPVLGLLGAPYAALSFTPAQAACSCECVDGEAVNVCEYSYDYKPYCSRNCPFAPYSMKPIQESVIPPVGMKSCEQRQVMNRQTQRYEWRTVCE